MTLTLKDIRRAQQVCYEVGVPNSGIQVSDTYIHVACANSPGGNQKSVIAFDSIDNELKCMYCGTILDERTSEYVKAVAENL